MDNNAHHPPGYHALKIGQDTSRHFLNTLAYGGSSIKKSGNTLLAAGLKKKQDRTFLKKGSAREESKAD